MGFGLVIGAGAIGMGFIADLLDESDWEIGFVNRSKGKVDRLNSKGKYTIKYPSSARSKKDIDVKQATTIANASKLESLVIKADVIFISVGANNIKSVAKSLERHLIKRLDLGYKGINIVVCENLMNSSDEFISALQNKDIIDQDNGFGVLSGVIFRRVRKAQADDNLTLLSENYNTIPVEKKGMIGSLEIEGFMPVENIKLYEEKKLYMFNAGHGSAAFIGHIFGKKYMHESIFSPFIQEIAYGILEECSIALKKKYGYVPLEKDIEEIINSFGSENFIDPFYQVCREPLRKISENERFVGGARLVEKYGGDWSPYAEAIAALLNYSCESDIESVKMQNYIEKKGILRLLQKYSNIKENEPISRAILRKYKRYRNV